MAHDAGKDPAAPVLTVYLLDRDLKQYSYSSFVIKLQFRLRHGGVPFEDALGTLQQAPKKKVPYVKFADSGKLMGDSALITQCLIERGLLDDLNTGLSQGDKAADYCLRSMIEDKLYYFLVHERWYDNYASMRDNGPFSYVPAAVRPVVSVAVFQFVKLMLHFQGTGRHSKEELHAMRTEAVEALANLAESARGKATSIGDDKPFWILGGPSPTEADFTLFGYLSSLLANGVTTPHTVNLVKQQTTLVDYVRRIHKMYFPDYHDLL